MCLTNDGTQLLRNTYRLNAGGAITFELQHVTLKAFTPRQLNDACDAIENANGFYKFTLLPPTKGETRFELHAGEDGVEIDLPGLKKRLVETLEMMA